MLSGLVQKPGLTACLAPRPKETRVYTVYCIQHKVGLSSLKHWRAIALDEQKMNYRDEALISLLSLQKRQKSYLKA